MNQTVRHAAASLVVTAAVIFGWQSCGGADAEGPVGPLGGEVCFEGKKICIEVPNGALTETVTLRISQTDDRPSAALSEAYEIEAVGRDTLQFMEPATVRMSFEALEPDAELLDNLLRIYTREGGEWLSLGRPSIDRVRDVVTGQTTHLSPFVVLRADRLPDGGLPEQIDGGPRDAGSVIVVPPIDAGSRPDAGRPDAGTRDAGGADASVPDAGIPDASVLDAGLPDAGLPDAGAPDAGIPDAGPPDAGPPDAGPPDAGPSDAGPPDAGPPDAGLPDAGPPDAGPPDAGPPDAGPPDAGPPDAGPPDAGAPDAGHTDAGVADGGDAG